MAGANNEIISNPESVMKRRPLGSSSYDMIAPSDVKDDS
jgi:hypothetical protein